MINQIILETLIFFTSPLYPSTGFWAVKTPSAKELLCGPQIDSWLHLDSSRVCLGFFVASWSGLSSADFLFLENKLIGLDMKILRKAWNNLGLTIFLWFFTAYLWTDPFPIHLLSEPLKPSCMLPVPHLVSYSGSLALSQQNLYYVHPYLKALFLNKTYLPIFLHWFLQGSRQSINQPNAAQVAKS